MTDPRADVLDRPPRLRIRPDGSIEIPLRGVWDPQTKALTSRDPVVLPEPTMVQLARIQDLVVAADEAANEAHALPPISAEITAKVVAQVPLTEDEQDLLDKRQTALRDRTRFAYSADGPWGAAVIEVIELLTGEKLDRSDLPGWASHWSVLSEMYGHFMDPFAGRADSPPVVVQPTNGSG